jgi:galactose mutarotase-like enzyme
VLPERADFRPTDYSPLGGLIDLRILTEVAEGGIVVVNQQGARIERLVLGRQLLLTEVTRSDGRRASTHPCVPIFGPETTTRFGLKQHGEARNQLWQVLQGGEEGTVLLYEVQDEGYPRGLVIIQKFRIKNGVFQLVTECVNSGGDLLPVNFGEHCYWNALYSGWEGLNINGEDVTEAIRETAVIQLQPRNVIKFSDQRRPIVLEQDDLEFAVLWTDSPDNPYGPWVCIEPVEGNPYEDFFGSPKSMIFPGEARRTELKISLLEL